MVFATLQNQIEKEEIVNFSNTYLQPILKTLSVVQ